ncbi:MAG: hypothetical protein HYX73_03480 [Acidobacteria bacterium]|nr:hypothetical protein [Acidobacteriota bacterium]
MVRLEPHHAQLLLQIYDLRREERLRAARAWLLPNFTAGSMKEFMELYPPGTDHNAYFRQVVTYWDLVAAIVNRGMIDEDLFFETTGEAMLIWLRVREVALEMRTARKNPLYLRNLETLAEKQEKWLATRAPEAMEETRKMIAGLKKAATAKK